MCNHLNDYFLCEREKERKDERKRKHSTSLKKVERQIEREIESKKKKTNEITKRKKTTPLLKLLFKDFTGARYVQPFILHFLI